MKLKLDENIDVRMAVLFAANGHDVETVAQEGLTSVMRSVSSNFIFCEWVESMAGAV